MTRELKLALIVGFSLVLIVTVLVSDHLSKARRQTLASPQADMPLALMQPEPAPPAIAMSDSSPRLIPAHEASEPAALEARAEPVPEPIDIHLGTKSGRGPAVPTTPDKALDSSIAAAPSKAIKEPPAETVSAERTHVVAEGETLFQIAKKYYGAGNSWPKIAQHNGIRAEAIKPGTTLRLPGLEASPALAVAPRTAPRKANDASVVVPKKSADSSLRPKIYTVKQGDTLASISRRMLGSPERLADLVRLNGIEDTDTLSIGQTIKLPNS